MKWNCMNVIMIMSFIRIIDCAVDDL